MIACQTCRHWQLEETQDWEAEGVGFGWCHGVRERWQITDEVSDSLERGNSGIIDIDGYEAVRRDALRASRAYVQDGSQYRAELFTAPDFFCALHAEAG